MDRITPEQRRKTMQAVKSSDTKLEIRLRKALWKRGYRYRKNYKKLNGKPDIVFISSKVAVFCDSKFWHGYDWENRKYDIKSNREFWWKKIERNIARDIEVTENLRSHGWTVLRFWEHKINKDLQTCVETVMAALNRNGTRSKHPYLRTRQTLQKELKQVYLLVTNGNYPQPDLRGNTRKITIAAQKKLKKWKPCQNHGPLDDAPFQVIDFFSGCGGLSLGFAVLSQIQSFFKLLGGCDIDSDAAATYEHNFTAPCIPTDIRTLVDNKRNLKAFTKKLNGYNPKKRLVVLGCAPCQGFTSHRKKNWSCDDPRNTLVSAFASIATQLKPECIIMENVPEMLSHKYWNYFIEARNILCHAGYIVKQSIYNTASFGVPQERFRALIIAMNRDFLLPKPLLEPNSFLDVRQAIGHLPHVEPGYEHPDDHMHRSAKHRPETLATIAAIPKNGGSRPAGVGPKCLDKVKGFYDVYGRLSWEKPSITVTHYARNPASGRFVHPEQNRGLTMREAALLQSFPNDFQFKGSFDSVFKQIGEAVPPKFACAVAANALVELLSALPMAKELTGDFQCVNEPVSSSFSSVIAGLKMSRDK